MNRENISNAVGGIADSYVQEAAMAPRRMQGSRRVLRRLIALAAALAVCLTISLPAAIALADAEGAYEALYALSPALAQQLKPVRRSAEDNGIRMEVAAAYISGDTAYIEITLRDLTGNRVDETTDLFDSYAINTPYDSKGTCTLAGFDPAEQTATFLIQLSNMHKEPITGDKITFSIREFLSGKRTFLGAVGGVELKNASAAPKTQSGVSIRGMSYGADGAEFTSPTCLVPDENQFVSVLPGITVTAYGYIDGQLHVQVYYEDILSTDNHGFISLQDASGKILPCAGNVDFWDAEGTGSYGEYIFAITPETAKNCTLYGDFTACESLTRGAWQVTFPLSNVSEMTGEN